MRKEDSVGQLENWTIILPVQAAIRPAITGEEGHITWRLEERQTRGEKGICIQKQGDAVFKRFDAIIPHPRLAQL